MKLEDKQIEEFLESFHLYFGHIGINKSYNTIRMIFDIDGLKERLEKSIKICEDCMRYKPNHKKRKPIPKIRSEAPFVKISSDVFGPFIINNNVDKGYFISITDIFTRFTPIYFAKANNAHKIIKALKDWISNHSKPRTFISDSGTNYVSKQFKEYCDKENIKTVQIPTYNPSSNWVSERINQTIGLILRIKNGKASISNIRECAERTLNQTYNCGIGNIPAVLAEMPCIFNVKEVEVVKNKRLEEVEESVAQKKNCR